MKALTVKAHWGLCLVGGFKWIETRPRPCKYRGRLAIHHNRDRQSFWEVWHAGHQYAYSVEARIVAAISSLELDLVADDDDYFCSITGGVELVECVPIVAEPFEATPEALAAGAIVVDAAGDRACYYRPGIGTSEACLDVSDQLPLGDFTPGRYGLIMRDPATIIDRCPYCWGRGEVDPDADVGGVIIEAHGRRYQQCPVCGGKGNTPAPVPARGQVSVPWNWNP